MERLSITVEIQAPPERVWAVLVDVERWPEWTSTVTSAQRLDNGPLEVGSRTRLEQPKLMPAVWEVTELDASGGRFLWETRRPEMRITAGHEVQASGGGTRATLWAEFSGVIGRLLGHLTRRLSEEYVATEANGLRRRSES